MCFFHPSPCNEVIEISNWNAPWSYQDRGIINFKVFLLFVSTIPQVILGPGQFNPVFLRSLSLISALANSSILAFHLCFPPINPLEGPQIMASGESFIFHTSVSSPIKYKYYQSFMYFTNIVRHKPNNICREWWKMQRLSEGRERGGSWITRGAVTDRGTRPSRSLKRKIRNHQWEAGDRDSGRYTLA